MRNLKTNLVQHNDDGYHPRNVLPSIRVPTLVLHRRDDTNLPVEVGRYVAQLVPGVTHTNAHDVGGTGLLGQQQYSVHGSGTGDYRKHRRELAEFRDPRAI